MMHSLKLKRISGHMAGALLLLLLLVLPGLSRGEESNLLENGSFEEIDSEGLPVGWFTDAYLMDEGYTVFSAEEDASAPDGKTVVSIRNIAANDARFSQIVSVEPESLYRFSGSIRADAVREGRGANLSIEGLYVFSKSVYDTDGKWTRIEWYGETGENQTEVCLFARVGGYSGESIGKAWFDDLKLEKVDAVPGSGIADLWYSEPSYSLYEDEDEEGDEGSEVDTGHAFWPTLILLAIAYCCISAYLLREREERQELFEKGKRKTSLFLWFSLGAAFLLRMILSYHIEGYMVDVNCFFSWGSTMSFYGPLSFYESTNFCDYPPLYMYVLGLNSLIRRWLNVTDPGWTRVIFRFIPSLCDVAACLMLCRFALRRNPGLDRRRAELFAAVLAFNPMLIVNSAAWGQMDSVLALCMLGVALLAIEGKWQFALPVFMLGVLIKPQALMLGFLGLTAVILVWIREPQSRKNILKGLAFTVLTAAVGILPFGIRQQPGWLISRYAETLSSYPYATLNAANFYYLLGGNWNKIENAAFLAAPLLLAVGCAAYGIVWSLRFRKDGQRKLWIELGLTGLFFLFFIICALTGASWSILGTGAMAFVFLIVLSLYIRKGDISFLPYLGALLFILLYVFGVKMHERYIFPAFLLLGCAWYIHRDRRILTVLLVMSAASFVNEGIVLDNSIRLGSNMGHLNRDTTVLANILSVVQVLSALYAVHLGLDLSLRNKPERKGVTLYPEGKKDNRLHWNRRDSAILAGILALYSALTLTTLGSTKAPQTAWTSTDYEETVTLDLQEKRESFAMLYFARVSRYDFSVSVSDDGVNWSDETWAEMAQGQCWKWKYVTESFSLEEHRSFNSGTRHWFSGRYVRLTAHQVGLALCEVMFRDPNGNTLPVSLVSRENGQSDSPLYSDPLSLIDEQDSLEAMPLWFPDPAGDEEDEANLKVAQPSWWNSTYFDEIYHARTAWEFLNHSTPYETTHPPLGKVLMSWGIALFGMTPFGWRFAGALAGIAMLAGMYLIGKQLTKSTGIAALMSFLMAMDCMHMTQTQIATIDSFPVLFIMFSFFFMLRFLQSDIGKTDMKRMLTDLGCSGLFIGLAIASKWIGLYAGAGLAIIYFTHCGRYLNRNKPLDSAQKQDLPLRRVLKLCLFCVLFFILVPVFIYLISYIPYFSYKPFTGIGNYLKDVLNSQSGMYNYHATPGLGMDHPFYSPWYEWPVIGKPMFYATKQYVFSEYFSHSIFCIGNPVIWFTAIATMLFCAAAWVQNLTRKEVPGDEKPRGGQDLFFLLCGFLAQYLPWILVPRGTYIYHYFASVPFLIISLGLTVFRLRLLNRKAGTAAAIILAVHSAAAFLLFFPYVTGIFAPTGWLDLGKGLLKIWY